MKRFTETTKWDDPWFLDLTGTQKLLFMYCCDKCDNSGVIDASPRKVMFDLNIDIDFDKEMKSLDSRIEKLESGKYWIKGFINYQFGKLKEASNLHKNVINLLEQNGIYDRIFNPSSTLDKGYMIGPSKGKGIVKVNEKGKEGIAKGNNYTDEFETAWISFGKYGVKKKAFEYWQKLTIEQQISVTNAIPSYKECVKAGRTQMQFEGWINPKNENWTCDWSVALKSLSPQQQTFASSSQNNKEKDYSDGWK
jgi:hypothetical protein